MRVILKMPTAEEWKNANVIQCIEYLLDDMKRLLPYGLIHPDVGIILSLFLGFLKKPRDQFTPIQLAPLHTEWGKRRQNVFNYFNQPISDKVLNPVFTDPSQEGILQLWVEWPAHWRCLHSALLKADRDAKAEQGKVKTGCKCANKPKPPAYHHWGNRVILLNAVSTVLNQLIGPYMNWWKRIPLPAVPIVLNNLNGAIVLPLDAGTSSITTPSTPSTTEHVETTVAGV